MKLHQDIKLFSDTLRAASQYLDIKLEFLVKDYWITLLLSRLAKSKYVDESVFKGGTLGASAIIAPTTVSLQGMFYAITGNKLGPQEMRDILFETGIELKSPHKYIGRMPDLSKAYQYILDNYSDVKENESQKEIDFATIKSNSAIQILNWTPELINQSLEIYDFLGRKVVQFNSINYEIIKLDNLRIESGVYFIVSGNSRYKFVKL